MTPCDCQEEGLHICVLLTQAYTAPAESSPQNPPFDAAERALAEVLMCDRSAPTPSVPTMSYRLRGAQSVGQEQERA